MHINQNAYKEAFVKTLFPNRFLVCCLFGLLFLFSFSERKRSKLNRIWTVGYCGDWCWSGFVLHLLVCTNVVVSIFNYLKKKKSKSNLHYTRLNTLSRVTSERCPFRGFAPGPTHQVDCSGGESLATCGRFDRLGIWTP